jgi:hypothetical protein
MSETISSEVPQEHIDQYLKILSLDTITPNSIVFFKVKQDNIKFLINLPTLVEKYRPLIKEKNLSFVLLGPEEDIETLDPESLAKLGYEKKEKSRIIQLT